MLYFTLLNMIKVLKMKPLKWKWSKKVFKQPQWLKQLGPKLFGFKPTGILAIMLLASSIIAGSGILLASGGQLAPMLSPISNWLGTLGRFSFGAQVYSAQGGLSQEEARTLYRQSLLALRRGMYSQALEGFKRLEPVYPGLRDLVLYHQAEAAEKMALKGQVPANGSAEGLLQQKLEALISLADESPLKATASYQLAQSSVRSNATATDKALKGFQAVQTQYPDTPYATGSLYYLGILAQKQSLQKAMPYWKNYLAAVPDGRFSPDILAVLDPVFQKAPPMLSPDWAVVMGQALAMQGNGRPEHALAYLNKAPWQTLWQSNTWPVLAKLQLRAGQKQQAIETITKGLLAGPAPLPVQEASNNTSASSSLALNSSEAVLDTLLTACQPNCLPVLKNLNEKPLKAGKSAVLWQLSLYDAEHAASYYQALLKAFPNDDYAPESSWRLLWPQVVKAYQSGHNPQAWQVFLTASQGHLARYPYARSAAAILFWRGKAYEALHRRNEAQALNLALKAYQQLAQTYPTSYYAFRAQGRLSALQHQKDPGWQLPSVSGEEWSKATQTLKLEDDLFAPAELGQKHNGQRLSAACKELAAMGVPEDINLLLKDLPGGMPLAIESWLASQQGHPDSGIRLLRDAMNKRARQGDLDAFKPTLNEQKLLYPLAYGQWIATYTPQNKLNPALAQGLMREESYFNELAISRSQALGLMQLLPSTAQEVAQWEHLSPFNSSDLFLPEVNVRLGTRYLRYLHETFATQPEALRPMLAVGAYNGGPNAMKRWIGSLGLEADPDYFVERIPASETREYIRKVFASAWNYAHLYGGS